ncbi:MAG: beta-N-acetylhexosaminidase [Deltaproteobacteria bacterium]|nr:beta-N-acetylhexosaminidase [Deltaproteobacteria bacterium]
MAGAVLVGGYPALEPEPRIARALAEGTLAGVTLFRRNVESPEQLRRTLLELGSKCTAPPLFAIDQEGGRVARLHAPFLKLPPMRVLGERGDLALTREAGQVLGEQLAAVGVTMDFAPVLDVDTNPDNPVIGDRSFSRDPAEVARHGLAFAEGLMTGGCLACGKHFPGHGDTDQDSHLALPHLAHDLERLARVELAPFRAATSLPALMTAHVVFSAFDAERPATLSSRVLRGLLREELGFEGLIISDDLEMKAVSRRWSIPESACLAIEAGADLLLVCSDVDALFAAREALAARASAERAFAERLRDAAARSLELRRSRPPTPLGSAQELEKLLCSERARRLERTLSATEDAT